MASAQTRERILNSAERLFAGRGFHGTSIREVAQSCGVRQSLVQYHFKSKEGLFRAVFERRILPMNHDRFSRLDQVEAQAARGKGVDPEQVVRAMVEPTVWMARNGRSGGELYPKLIAQIINDPEEHARRITREFNDPVARAVIKALRAAIPEISPDELPWCYVFAVGAMISAMSGTGRVKELSDGRCDPNDVERIVALLVPFIVGGMRAVANRPKVKPANTVESAKSTQAAKAAKAAKPAKATKPTKPTKPAKPVANPRRRGKMLNVSHDPTKFP
jgi:AcrR family transcriptional regulator